VTAHFVHVAAMMS